MKVINSTTVIQHVLLSDATFYICTLDFSTSLLNVVARSDFTYSGNSITFSYIKDEYNAYGFFSVSSYPPLSISFPAQAAAVFPLHDGEQYCITAVSTNLITNRVLSPFSLSN